MVGGNIVGFLYKHTVGQIEMSQSDIQSSAVEITLYETDREKHKLIGVKVSNRLIDFQSDIYHCLKALKIQPYLIDIQVGSRALFISLQPYFRLRIFNECTDILMHVSEHEYAILYLITTTKKTISVDCPTRTVFLRFMLEHLVMRHANNRPRMRCMSCLF